VPVRLVDVRPVSHLVEDGLRISPKPREWPKQSAKAERKQAEALDRVRLRMLFFLGDFFRQDVNEPEGRDADDRHDEQDQPRQRVSNGV